jgi:hypothetical protein
MLPDPGKVGHKKFPQWAARQFTSGALRVLLFEVDTLAWFAVVEHGSIFDSHPSDD